MHLFIIIILCQYTKYLGIDIRLNEHFNILQTVVHNNFLNKELSKEYRCNAITDRSTFDPVENLRWSFSAKIVNCFLPGFFLAKTLHRKRFTRS